MPTPLGISHRLLAAGLLLAGSLSACVQKAPPELLQAVESLDQQLVSDQAAEFAPEDYARFVKHWVAVKGRIQSEEDVIWWPWEPNALATDLHLVQEEGMHAASVAARRKEAERLEAEARLANLERRFRVFARSLDDMGGRIVLGQGPIETELLVRQARALWKQGRFARSVQTVQEAASLLDEQASILNAKLGRYVDAQRIEEWRKMVRQTVEWSRTHRTAVIVVSKAERRLTLYHNGRLVGSYPVRLGYNGILEKRYQGDGATPEGWYRILHKRDRGQTQFYRALVLDYPNGKDRRHFQQDQRIGAIPVKSSIGGQIEIHGEDNLALSQTLGCLMLTNRHMDVLFGQAEVGTPVTIVGATQIANPIALALTGLDRFDEGQDAEEPPEDRTAQSKGAPPGPVEEG